MAALPCQQLRYHFNHITILTWTCTLAHKYILIWRYIPCLSCIHMEVHIYIYIYRDMHTHTWTRASISVWISVWICVWISVWISPLVWIWTSHGNPAWSGCVYHGRPFCTTTRTLQCWNTVREIESIRSDPDSHIKTCGCAQCQAQASEHHNALNIQIALDMGGKHWRRHRPSKQTPQNKTRRIRWAAWVKLFLFSSTHLSWQQFSVCDAGRLGHKFKARNRSQTVMQAD